MTKLMLSTAAVAVVFAGQAFAQSREQIQITGSSTVFPYAQAVVERFSTDAGFPAPVIESTGSGGGIQIFCEGVGEQHPDIANSSRAMQQGEFETCQANGVESVTEVRIGSDGLSIAMAREGADIDLTKAQIFQALASEVEVDGEIVANPHTTWNQIDPSFPEAEITVFGPPPTSGTRDAFVELVMEEGCQEFPAIAALEEARMEEVCQRMRQDGPFVEAGENDNLIVQRLTADPGALGIFGYSFLFENEDVLKAVTVDGIDPTPDTIADGSYTVSRPLFFYVKNAHLGVIPGLAEYVAMFVSEEAIGPDGYLIERGLIPAPEDARAAARQASTAAETNLSFD